MSDEEIDTDIKDVTRGCSIYTHISLNPKVMGSQLSRELLLGWAELNDHLWNPETTSERANELARNAVKYGEGSTLVDQLIDAGDILHGVVETTLEKYRHLLQHKPHLHHTHVHLHLEHLLRFTRLELLNTIESLEAKKEKMAGELHFHSMKNEWSRMAVAEAHHEIQRTIEAAHAYEGVIIDEHHNVAGKHEIKIADLKQYGEGELGYSERNKRHS